MVLSLHPSVRLIETSGPTFHLVFRGVRKELPEAPYRVLRALGEGATLGELTPEVLNLESDKIGHCFTEVFPEWSAKAIVGNPRLKV